MPVEIQSAWIQTIGGALGTLLVAFVIFYFGRLFERWDKARRKIIETGTTTTALLNQTELGPISMSVDKGFLSRQSDDQGISIPVMSAYNHVVGVSNIGIDALEKPEIDITLDNEALIVEIEVKAESIPDDKIEIRKDPLRPNFCRIIPQYINKSKNLTISVLSINSKTTKCDVLVGGIGISQKIRSSSAESASPDNPFVGLSKMFFILIAIGTLFAFALINSDLRNPSQNSRLSVFQQMAQTVEAENDIANATQNAMYKQTMTASQYSTQTATARYQNDSLTPTP